MSPCQRRELGFQASNAGEASLRAEPRVASAHTVWKSDEQVDAMCTSLFRELLTYMMEDPRNITFCIHLMFCAKNIERMGDHATNIAETVYFIVEGHPLMDERPKGDSTASARIALRQ